MKMKEIWTWGGAFLAHTLDPLMVVAQFVPSGNTLKTETSPLHYFYLLSAMDEAMPVFDYKAVVSYTGKVIYIPHMKVSVLCRLKLKRFPYDTQTCGFRFGSWTYHTKKVIHIGSKFKILQEDNLVLR